MSEGLQRRGLHGTGLTEVLREAHAPKGVLYHHFPDGKTELAVAAISSSVAIITAWLDSALAKYPDPLEAIERWVAKASRGLLESDFEAGCPLATVALETTASDVAVRSTLAEAFASMRARIEDALVRTGTPASEATGLATLIVATYEGGLLQARVANDARPLLTATESLVTLIRMHRGAAA
jgi:TetR/AcrR family transcriptional repressor of lmrAB and yxaGH operons